MARRSGKTGLVVNWVWIVILGIFTLASLSLFSDSEYMEKTGPGAVWATIVLFLGFIGYNIYRIMKKRQLRQLRRVDFPSKGEAAPNRSVQPIEAQRAFPVPVVSQTLSVDPGRFEPPEPDPTGSPASIAKRASKAKAVVPGPQRAANGEILYRGRPLSDSVDTVARLKRQGKLEEALDVAQGAMFAMAEAGANNPDDVMEHYVIEVAIILHKMKRYQDEAQTLQEWLDLGLPAPREDFRADIRKRLAKANEQWAKAEGRDATAYTAEWRLLIDEHKDAQKRHMASGVAVPSSGRTAAGGSHYISSRPNRRQRFMPTLDDLLEPDFVAVDFETANRQSGASACQVALVRFLNGKVVDRYVTYLKPPPPLDHYEFTHIHGITEQDTQRAPRWNEVAPGIAEFIGARPVYAHNAAFDAKVWEELDSYYGIQTISNRFFCTYLVSREALPTLPDHKLPTVVGAIDTNFELDHHKADSDAEACGLIVAALQYYAVGQPKARKGSEC